MELTSQPGPGALDPIAFAQLFDTPWPEGAGILGSISRTYLCFVTTIE
jgi:hypothetical protein